MISLGYEFPQGTPEWELQAGLKDVESASREGPSRAILLKSAQEHLKKGYEAFSQTPSADAFRLAGLLEYKIKLLSDSPETAKLSKAKMLGLKFFAGISRNEKLTRALDALGDKGKKEMLFLEKELEGIYGRFFLEGEKVDLQRFRQKLASVKDKYQDIDPEKLPKDVRYAFKHFLEQVSSLEQSVETLKALKGQTKGLGELNTNLEKMKPLSLVKMYRHFGIVQQDERISPFMKGKIAILLQLIEKELGKQGIDLTQAKGELPAEFVVANKDWKGDVANEKAAVEEFALYIRSDGDAKNELKLLLDEIIAKSTLPRFELEAIKLKVAIHENNEAPPEEAILRRATDDTPRYLDELMKNEALQAGIKSSETFQFEGLVVNKVRDYLRPIKGERQTDALGRIKTIENKLIALKKLGEGSSPSAKAFGNIYDQIMGHVEVAKEMQIRIAVDEAKKIGALFAQPDPTGPAMRPTSLKEDLAAISAIIDSFAKSRERANAPALDHLEANAKELYKNLEPVFGLDSLGVGELKNKLESEIDKQKEARFNLLVKEKDEALAIDPFREKKLSAVEEAMRKFNRSLAPNSPLKSRVNATLDGIESEKQFVNPPKDPGEYITWLESKASVLEGRGVPEALKARVAAQLYTALEGFGPEAMAIVDKHSNIEQFIEKSESADLVAFKKYRKAVKELTTANFPESTFDPEPFLTKVRQGHYGAAGVPVARMGQFMKAMEPIMLGGVNRELSQKEGEKLAELTKAWIKLENHYKGILEKASKDPDFSTDQFMKSDDYLKFLIQVAQVKLLNAQGKFYSLANLIGNFYEDQIDGFFKEEQHEEIARQELVQKFT